MRVKTTLPYKARRLICALCATICLLPAASRALDAPTSMRVAMLISPTLQLYPLRVTERDAVSLLDLVYESLVTLDDSGQPQPALATDWTTADGKEWRFTIRDGVHFHDGRVLTAYDVAATMDAIKAIAAEDVGANEKGLYSLVPAICSSWQADDDRTLRVRASRPYYGLLYAMTFPVLQAQSTLSPCPPGTGPYRIESYTPGDELWMTGNQNWWKNAPHVSEITARWFADENAAMRAFESEDIDIVMTRSTVALRYRGTVTSRANSYDYATRQLECLLLNHVVTRFKEPRMRQAIAYAINKPQLASNVYQRMVSVTDTLQRPGSWLYDTNAAVYGYDPERANALLDELGWNLRDADNYRYKQTDSGTSQLSFRLGYYDEAGNALRKEAANEIATMLRAVGIRVQTQGHSFAKAIDRMNVGDYDMFLCAYNFDVTPDPYFLLVSSSTMEGNYVRYRSDAMKKLCQKLRKAYTAEDFQATWFEIQELMAQDVPFIPLYWRSGVVLTRYAYSAVRDIREFSLLRSIELYR